MIVGLLSITEGDIFIKGKSITHDFEEAISHVGGIVENPEMYKFLSGYKNLIHYARMGQKISRERIDEVVKQVGMEKRIHEKVGRYSLGMRQRLGLAQALLHSPSLLVLDEPTNGLDPAGIREFREHLRTLAREHGVAVLISSHLLSEMELTCDRIAIIQEGKLVGVQKVNDFVEVETGNEEISVNFTVEPREVAFALLKERFPGQTEWVEGNPIAVVMDREEIPDTVAYLVQEKLKVYGVEIVTKTLEDKFLEVTGGNQVV
jgi:ABC-2 type transport system ATP-binding protein